jgi:hypothetical protein
VREGYHASFLIAIIFVSALARPMIMTRLLPDEKTGPIYEKRQNAPPCELGSLLL